MDERFPLAYRVFRRIVRMLLRIFFSEIACDGAERVPVGPGGLVIAWHPNGLIDPALIFSFFPRRIIFGARHGLLKWPVLGRLFRAIGTIPIYRADDLTDKSRAERYEANKKSLDILARELASGSFSALFPEGLSHDLSHLSEVKTGAARLYNRACTLTAPESSCPIIVPIGLHYDRKNIFRSRVLLQIYDPIEIPQELMCHVSSAQGAPSAPEALNASGAPNTQGAPNTSGASNTQGAPADTEILDERTRITRLTKLIGNSLAETAHATDDWELHHLMHRARKLVRAERAHRTGSTLKRPDIREYELGFSRIWHAYQIRVRDSPEQTEQLLERLASYDKLIRAAGIEDHEISSGPGLGSPKWYAFFIAQLVTVYVFLPPVLILGYVINAIPYFLLKHIDRKYSVYDKDGASIKIIVGSVLFPLFWILAATSAVVLRQQVEPWFPVVPERLILLWMVTFLFSIGSGFLALRYAELSAEMARAIRVRATRRRRKKTLLELQTIRADLFDELIEMSRDLDLPGQVTPGGEIIADE